MRIEGKLLNTDGEFIASGPCELDRDRGEVTMWPSWEMHMLEREHGALVLELDDGSRLAISDKHLTFKLTGSSEQRISVYRLRIVERVPDHLAAGYTAATEARPPAAADAPEPATTPADAARAERTR
ncbi:MAG: hypothetical protein IVW36_00515 [Dehalococcoidia bacterium]|nr:hypothetical protein [Dehalococcoidia bacterium]